MGIVFQTAHFVRSLTVGENLALARSLSGLLPLMKPPSRRYSGDLGLAHKWDAPGRRPCPSENNSACPLHGPSSTVPGLILADEPTSALDDANTDAVLSLLARTGRPHRSGIAHCHPRPTPQGPHVPARRTESYRMKAARLARRNVLHRPLETGLSVLLLAFGVGIISLMLLMQRSLTEDLDRNIKDIDLVLGAKGSPLAAHPRQRLPR